MSANVTNPKRFFKDENTNVAWLCMKEVGEPVEKDDNWLTSRKDSFPLFNGYQAVQLVRSSTDVIFKVVCSINKSSLGIPIYQCQVYKYDYTTDSFSDE